MADDKYLSNVQATLRQDGWILRPTAFSLRDSGYQFWIDIDAQKDERRIVVEVKSWRTNFLQDWYQAFGQYMTYSAALARKNHSIELFLAVPEDTFNKHFQMGLIQNMVRQHSVKLCIFNVSNHSVVTWK
jgi:hypothetical protein